MKIHAAHRLLATVITASTEDTSWFDSLSKDQQDKYIEMHPDSKYAQAKRKHEDGGTDYSHEDTSTSTSTKDNFKAEPAKNPDRKAKAKEAITKFLTTPAVKPHSEERRSFGKMLKAKAHTAVMSLRDEVKDVGVAAYSVKKLMHGKKLSHTEKHALRATCTRLAIIVGGMALGGGLAHGLAAGGLELAKHIATDFMEHGLVGTAEKTLMHGSSRVSAADDSDDAMLKALVGKFADYMASSPNLGDIMQKSLGEESEESDDTLSDLPEDLEDPSNSDEADETSEEKLKDDYED